MSYVPDKKDGRKNDRTSKLLLNKFTGTVIFTIIFTSIFFIRNIALVKLLNLSELHDLYNVLNERKNFCYSAEVT